MQHSCSKQNHYKTHTQKPRKIAHTLCSRDIKYKIHESAHDKYFLDNDIESYYMTNCAKYLWGLQFALDSRQLQFFVLYFAGNTLVQYATDQQVHMTRAWRMLDK